MAPVPGIPYHGLMQKLRCSQLRAIRQARGISGRELARRAGVDPSFLLRLERGERRARFGTVLAVAAALGIDPDELLEAGA